MFKQCKVVDLSATWRSKSFQIYLLIIFPKFPSRAVIFRREFISLICFEHIFSLIYFFRFYITFLRAGLNSLKYCYVNQWFWVKLNYFQIEVLCLVTLNKPHLKIVLHTHYICMVDISWLWILFALSCRGCDSMR